MADSTEMFHGDENSPAGADMFHGGVNFPAGADIPQRSDILTELNAFDIRTFETVQLIDSTHDSSDIRLNYIIDRKWVLRFCNAPGMTEKRMNDLYRLIERYHALGIQCPQFLADSEGRFLHPWKQMICYLSEYIDRPLAGDKKLADGERLVHEVQESVAGFAAEYSGVDLSETMGMYSLFDLSPFDIPNGIDEKEDNFNQLIVLLRSEKEDCLAERLIERHAQVRKNLKAVYRNLPRCVFQGDENFSNVLIDENERFIGFIDFNLAGTEVIVNQLVNLAGFDYDEKHAEPEGAQTRLTFAVNGFKKDMNRMLRIYHATESEMQAMRWYAWIVMTAKWPALCYFRECMKGALRNEILEMLSLIAAIPEEQLFV